MPSHNPDDHKRLRNGQFITICACGEQVTLAEWADHKYGPTSSTAILLNKVRKALDQEFISPDEDYDLWRVSPLDALQLAEKALEAITNG